MKSNVIPFPRRKVDEITISIGAKVLYADDQVVLARVTVGDSVSHIMVENEQTPSA